jgi:TolB protein
MRTKVKETKMKNTFRLLGFIALAALAGFSTAGCSSAPSNTSVDVITYDQATLQELKRITEDGLSKDWLSVSPNGSMLLYCESLVPLKRWTDISNDRIKSYQIMLLRDAEKPAKTQLVTDKSISPAWYNNESYVYSVIEGGVPKLIKSNIAGGGKVYITRNAVGQYDIRPNVRGNLVLCETEINKKKQILRLTDSGTDITIMGEGEAPFWHPANPLKFLYTKNGDIYEMDLNTYQPTKLFGESNFRSANPRYSSDGTHILFQKECLVRVINSKNGKAREVKHWHVFLVKVDGTGLVQLTDGNVDAFSPVWGKDNTIFFVSNANSST